MISITNSECHFNPAVAQVIMSLFSDRIGQDEKILARGGRVSNPSRGVPFLDPFCEAL